MKKYLSHFMALILVLSLILQMSICVLAENSTNNTYAASPSIETAYYSSADTDTDADSVFQKMVKKYSEVSLSASGSDITCFWDMITKRALGLKSVVDVDFYSLDYDEMTPQGLGKVLVTMVNNNFGVDTKVVDSQKSVIDILNSYLLNGEFTKSGNSGVTMASEQVWVMFGYVLSGSGLDDSAWDYMLSQQNTDGGFGYGTWSDVSTSLWVKTLIELAGKDNEFSEYLQSIDDYVENNMDYIKQSYDTNSLASIVSYNVFDSKDCDDLLEYIIDTCYDPEGYFTWGEYEGENSFATQAGAQMIGEYFNGSVYSDLFEGYSPVSDEESDKKENEDEKVIYVTNNTDNSQKETNNRSTKNQTINNYYQQADPVVVTNTITKEIVKDIEIPANEITVNSNPISNVQPTITLNIPDYRIEIRIFLGIMALAAITYSFSTFFKVFGGANDEK
ncbi:MAG: hypothetical protein II995_04930 [Oscillospiraceae bacterium]|nr:hypothetical protein [Oscillospiraceae bacterium]